MNKLKELREKVNLTQRELANFTGLAIQTIQAYEQGTRELKKASIFNLMKIAEYLEVEVKELIK